MLSQIFRMEDIEVMSDHSESYAGDSGSTQLACGQRGGQIRPRRRYRLDVLQVSGVEGYMTEPGEVA